MTDLEIELNDNPDAENFLSFFDLKPETAANNVLVVDRGFEGATEEYMTLLAPKGKKKSKQDGKTKIAKQHTQEQAGTNRTVMRVRNIVERMFSTTIKIWSILGGKPVHFAYFEHIPQYMDIACAVSNAFRVCLDAKKGENDDQDFETMKNRMGHKNEIPPMLKKSPTNKLLLKNGKFTRFDPEEEIEVVPVMSMEEIRNYACGPYALKLATPYVTFWANIETNIKFSFHKTARRLLIKVAGLKSRFSPRISREVYLLFKNAKLSDTMCTCHGGLRAIGGCAHAIAVLRLLGQLTDRIEPDKPTRSQTMLKRALWYFKENDYESDSESNEDVSSDDSFCSDDD